MAVKGYISNRDGVQRTGEFVDSMLTKIEDLENVTTTKDGTMSAADKVKLDSLEDDEELTVEDVNEILTL